MQLLDTQKMDLIDFNFVLNLYKTPSNKVVGAVVKFIVCGGDAMMKLGHQLLVIDKFVCELNANARESIQSESIWTLL